MTTRKDELASIHYDMYKDVYGIRPRHIDYDLRTEAELEQMLEELSVELVAELARQDRAEANAIVEFERLVTQTINCGAGDRATALRWIKDESGCDGDWEYLCFLFDLPYGYFLKAA